MNRTRPTLWDIIPGWAYWLVCGVIVILALIAQIGR